MFPILIGVLITLGMTSSRNLVRSSTLRGLIWGELVFGLYYLGCFAYYTWLYDREGECVDFYHVSYTYVPSLAFEVHLLFGAFYGLLFAVIDRLSSLLTGSRSQVGTGDLKRP